MQDTINITAEPIKLNLGLDISSSYVGYCLMNTDCSAIVKIGHVNLTKINGLFNKADFTIMELENIFSLPPNVVIEHAFVEANAKMFAAGQTTADVLFTLAKINALVSYLIYKKFGATVHDTNVVSARSAIGYKDIRAIKKPVKEKVREYVLNTFNVNVKTREMTRGVNKGKVVLVDGAADEIDAFVIAKGGYNFYVKTSGQKGTT